MSPIVTRLAAYNRQRGRCFHCSGPLWERALESKGDAQARILPFDPLTPDRYANVPIDHALCTTEHLVPRSENGGDQPDNIVAACRFCNSHRGNRSLNEWRGQMLSALPFIRAGTERCMPNVHDGYDEVPWEVEWRHLFHVEVEHLDVVMWLHEQGECWIRHSRNDALLFPQAAFVADRAGSGWMPGLPQRIPGVRVLLSDDTHAASFKRRFGGHIVQRCTG